MSFEEYFEDVFQNAEHVSALEKRPDLREELRSADLIFGIDTATGLEYIFYGRAMLKDISKGRDAEWDEQKIIAFRYDQRVGGELEYLEAIVRVLKGVATSDYGDASR